jgi:hypothetical protein
METLEAPYESFRDWQRTQTQSPVTVGNGLRQQMDVWFCKGRNHGREALMHAAGLDGSILRAPRKRASEEVCFLLTIDYMEVRKGFPIGAYHVSGV